MRLLAWAVRLTVFFLLLAFAAKNVEPVTLRFYFDLALQTPLVLALFAFFAAGAVFGMLALLGPLLRQRRRISKLKKLAGAPGAPPLPPL
ncbi:MAG TPA: lipopolysaccharide assembly protein LapA domain-containing protein [Burkholderiales bacterium]